MPDLMNYLSRRKSMASSFKPNKRGLDQMQRDIQRELSKRPVTIPIHAETPEVTHGATPSPITTVHHNYTGPVVNYTGDGNPMLAFSNNGDISQAQETTHSITEGYEELAKSVTELRAALMELGLNEKEVELATESADEVLQAVTQPEPDQSLILKSVSVLKGLLSNVVSGVSKGVSAEAASQAGLFIARLAAGLPF